MAALAAPLSGQAPRDGSVTNLITTRADDDAIVVTRHRITLGDRTLAYTARAGLLPIRDNETGEPHGRVFFVSYTVDRPPGQPPRPLTFAWNGGPGANSMLVHLFAFGPRVVKTSGDATRPLTIETEIVDNQATWLDQTDLVFVDPVGTGFSRPTRPEYASEFYSVSGDIASIAEFVRVYRTRFDAWDAPLVLAGESYGVWRAAGVAEALERRGQRIAGVILISGGIPVGPVMPEEVKAALFVPVRTATALYHHRLAPELQSNPERTLREVEAWALREYAPALARGDSLTPAERRTVTDRVAGYTGVSAMAVDTALLVLPRQRFAEQLLADQKRVLARFDTRLTTGQAEPEGRAALVHRYLRNELGYRTDLAYQGLDDAYTPAHGSAPSDVGSRWDYDQGNQSSITLGPDAARDQPPSRPSRFGADDGPPGGAQPWLRRAMRLDPGLRAFVAAGLYDSLNSCFGNRWVVAHLEPSERDRIDARCYEGGHMMYEDAANRTTLRADIRRFFDRVLAAR